MAGIFISYRHDDSLSTAGRLSDHLKRSFRRSHVFIDADDIPRGTDYVKRLHARLMECDLFLAIIGPKWLQARNIQGNRCLDDREDWVRIEIASALLRHITIIPVTIDNTPMPNESELPDELKPLARRQAFQLIPPISTATMMPWYRF
jgi:hypothetical protein